jgi:ribosome maturation protein Sdo1
MRFKDRWKRHSIAVPKLTRTYERITKAKDWTPENKSGTHVTVEELVHIHDVYREVVDGKVTKQLWHRGALVGSV